MNEPQRELKEINLVVNDRSLTARVEPRLHLADFLRDHLRLTGTHLGCEHGVCGACTVLLDGVPARSCITFAVACDAKNVRTIEGFEEDPTMSVLREKFSEEHGLQCGFCTPGMLITSRDMVRRLPKADERQIRVELSGNLCRCTGYKGIVNAVRATLDTLGTSSINVPEAAPISKRSEFTPFAPTELASTLGVSENQSNSDPAEAPSQRKGWTHVEESFVVNLPPDTVWHVFMDLPLVASCMPGAELEEHDEKSIKGRLRVKMGLITASFSGAAVIERDESSLTGRIKGGGNDQRSGSRTKGEIRYELKSQRDGESTMVVAHIDYSLQGPLAQFSRSGLVQEMGRILVAEFAANLNTRLTTDGDATSGQAAVASSVSAWKLLWRALISRFN